MQTTLIMLVFYLFILCIRLYFVFNGAVRNYPLLLSFNRVFLIYYDYYFQGSTEFFFFCVLFSEIKKHVLVYMWKDASERVCVLSEKRAVSKNSFLCTKKYFWKGLLKFLWFKIDPIRVAQMQVGPFSCLGNISFICLALILSVQNELCLYDFLLVFTLGVHTGQNVKFINRPELCSKIVLLTGKPKSLKNSSFPRLYLLLEIQGVGELEKMVVAFKNGNCFSPVTDFHYSCRSPQCLGRECRYGLINSIK